MGKRKKYTVEFIVRATPTMLYSMINSPDGLSQWFSEVKALEDQIFLFNWEDSSEKARMERSQANKVVKFKWLERDKPEYLTLEISKDELTDEVALIITDFDDEDEIEAAKQVWEANVEQLKGQLGA